MISDLQIEANKENSKLSPGPKDTGKTKFNAVTHGLCSKKFVSESERKEFNAIFEELIDELNPQGIVELRIVERMAYALWDLQRIAEKESIHESNEKIENKLSGLKSFLDMLELDHYSTATLKEREELEKQLIALILPNDVFMRYKSEAENRFYKALKIWKEFKKK